MIQKIVGISFNKTDNPNVEVGASIDIIHDKTNKYSSKAIAVMFQDQLLGHIGEKDNEEHENIFNVLPLTAKVQRVARLEEGEEFGKFKEGEITTISVEFPMATDEVGGLRSFTEPEEVVDFNVAEHEYTHKGKKLRGGSTYIKKWIKGFDAEAIAPRYAKSMGSTTKEILGLWQGGGKVSADFGTSIHEALEHYENFKEIGAIIRDKKDKPHNTALPTHPLLREIVMEFTANFTHKGDNVVVEAFVSNVELGLCGMIDRLLIVDEEQKICRVQDYKINVDCEEEGKEKFLGQFADLPKNKLSKYQLQMSFYARLLELSGWNVEGLDAFVYDGEWKHYPMEVLKLDF